MSKILNNNEFENEVLKSSIPVLVDFYADWCGPCKMMGPVLDSIEKDYKGKARIVKINVDQEPELAAKYGVMSIPNFKLFKNGQVKDEALGAIGKNILTAKLDALL